MIDTGISTFERAVVGWFTLDMTTEEYLAYVFDWRQIALDYVIGVGIDFLVDGIADRFRPEVTYSGLGGEFADNIGDGITREMRETMEDTMEEGLERTVRETTEETAERSARDMTEGVMDQLDDFDEYERFYRDMYDAQGEINDAYEDFLEELRELQREGVGVDDLKRNLSEGGTYSGDLMSAEEAARYSEHWRELGICSDKTWSEFISANPNGTIDDYFEIVQKQSPWTLGETGTPTTLKSGDRFFMAVENDAPEN